RAGQPAIRGALVHANGVTDVLIRQGVALGGRARNFGAVQSGVVAPHPGTDDGRVARPHVRQAAQVLADRRHALWARAVLRPRPIRAPSDVYRAAIRGLEDLVHDRLERRAGRDRERLSRLSWR